MPCYDPGDPELDRYKDHQSYESARILCEIHKLFDFGHDLTDELIQRIHAWGIEHAKFDAMNWLERIAHARKWDEQRK